MFFSCYICLNTCKNFQIKAGPLFSVWVREKNFARSTYELPTHAAQLLISLLGQWTKYFTSKLIHTSVCWQDAICYTVFFRSCSLVGLNFHVPWRHLCSLGDRLSFFLPKTFKHFEHEKLVLQSSSSLQITLLVYELCMRVFVFLNFSLFNLQ